MSSLILQQFAEGRKNPEVLRNPQEFLGLHTSKVLDFWLKIDGLSEEQWRVVNEREEVFFNENYSEWYISVDLALKASKEVVRRKYAYYVRQAATIYDLTNVAADWATLELIGGVENPTFLPMFDDL